MLLYQNKRKKGWLVRRESSIVIIDDGKPLTPPFKGKRDIGRRWHSRMMMRLAFDANRKKNVRTGKPRPSTINSPLNNWRDWKEGMQWSKWIKRFQRASKRERARMEAEQDAARADPIVIRVKK
jgi:hypothetical protein